MSYIEKRNKKRFTEKKDKIVMDLDIDTLDLLLVYSLSDNPLVNKKSLINLRRFITSIKKPADNFEVEWRMEFLEAILEANLDKSIFRNTLLKEYCSKKLGYDNLYDAFDQYDNEYVVESEIVFIGEYIQERLTYIYLYEHQEELEEALMRLKTSSDTSSNMSEINSLFTNVIGTLNKEIQMAKSESSYSAMDFSIMDASFDGAMRKTIDEINKPANHIRTGLQYLNKFLDGGFENGRFYLVCALPKSFKSGFMLNAAIWACKYNNFTTKDPDKIPTVFYVSQENSQRETIERIYTHVTGEELRGKSEEEAMDVIRKYMNEGKDPKDYVDFRVIYRPHKSISTNDLDGLIDDLELQGREVVMLIHDYTKRIRSSMNYPDIRLELGEVVNDFCTIAKIRNIPVLSAAQLNREAYRIIETSLAANKNNLTKELNKSHVGESALMIENTDYAFIINPEEDMTTHEKFLGFKLIASRGKESKITYFLQKFKNGMRLEEDVLDKKPKSVENMGETQKEFNPNAFREKARTITKSTKVLEEVTPENDELNI